MFRKKLIDKYGHICMVPGCGYKTFVDAHHITKRSKGGQHYIDNGILLCPNHHREADREILTKKELKTFCLKHIGSDPAGSGTRLENV